MSYLKKKNNHPQVNHNLPYLESVRLACLQRVQTFAYKIVGYITLYIYISPMIPQCVVGDISLVPEEETLIS